ncbi:MAG: DEAD/DEAH box helicase [Myxococcales bacterium]|nr:DEAD/DEAH box helicase [Myxococcales bacterium]
MVRADARLDLASESDQLAGLRVMLGRVALEPSHFLRQASPTMHFGPTSTVAAAFADDVLYVGRVDRRLVRMVEGGTARVTGVPREAIPEIGASLARAVDLPLAIDPALSDRIVPGACEPILVASRPSAVATPGDLQGIVFSWVVCPAPGAAVRTPGEPPEQFFWTVDGELALVDRSLRSELDACAAAALRTNAPLQDDGPEMFWSCSDADEVLAQLGRARDAGVEVRWIGSPVTSRAASFDSLKLQLSSGRDWFGASGGLEVDGAVVPLAELLAAIRERRRSVKLDDNTWATLPDEFANALRALARVTTGKAKEKLSPLHAALFDSLEQSGVEVEAPTRWRELTTRVREAATLTVRAPRGLKAQLRPYQREGYEWLVRTAHWSTGACLADDMGLGKTVQAIALLLQRARGGRALVVCPTSVAFNWERECARFAPSLRVATYTGRDAELPKLGASDIMIVSYDLLALYPTRFEGVWNTVVIDEAQALKNHTTRRARAVHGLEADFVVALTGTPVENRSTEAWSLFRSIAPGYLGSYEDFRERFAIPIERDGDTHARTALGALMRPLILRRLKRDVARDLPDRIESRLDVTLGDFERDTYDRLRKSSIDLLQNRPPGMSPLEARILALAALTRLRQTACHARLVDPDAPEVSAKQLAVTELLGELKEEGRRALVFSQFTSLLDLVEPGLTAAGLRWLRLDGSTPAAKRRQLVDEFQAGDVDVFLLSLKAGGAGLNLTAADTVIHLDPWWNPAVEDQATDRAHRIGQTQKVTVVRVVALETVEEAILELHSTKRELVDALLDGTGEASVVSLDELMRLVGAS